MARHLAAWLGVLVETATLNPSERALRAVTTFKYNPSRSAGSAWVRSDNSRTRPFRSASRRSKGCGICHEIYNVIIE